MKILEPFRTRSGFLQAFDNGGRFWSLGSSAGDGVITKGELAKAGPSLLASRTAILYFELLRGFLAEEDAEAALASLDAGARRRWKKHQPRRCSPAQALSLRPGSAVLLEAAPARASATDGQGLTSTILMPVGKAMIPVVTPVEKTCQLWRLGDGATSRDPAPALLAVSPKRLDLSKRPLAIAAVVHESSTATGTPRKRRRWLTGVAACPL